MKLKIRFPSILLPYGKKPQYYKFQSCNSDQQNPQSLRNPHAGEWISGIVIFLMIALLLLTAISEAQDNPAYTALKIGDRVPDIAIDNIINYPTNTAKISDFKDKILILDFWATWCSSCIAMFPHEFKIQQDLKDKVVFVLVNSIDTKDTRQKVLAFLKERDRVYRFASVTKDSMLTRMFPHRELPHYVWIKDHKVIAVTGSQEITIDNISKATNSNQTTLRTKVDQPYAGNKMLDAESSNHGNEVLYRVILKSFDENAKSVSGIHYLQDKKATRLFAVNAPILRLYFLARPELGNIPLNRVYFDVKDRDKFTRDSSSFSWKQRNLFTYELIYPVKDYPMARSIMLQDLQRYFGYDFKLVDKPVASIILRCKACATTSKDSLTEPTTNMDERNSLPKYLKNYSWAYFVNRLNTVLPVPFVDETGLKGNIDLSIPADLTDIKVLTYTLEQQGFSVSQEIRQLKCLYISDKAKVSANLPTSPNN